VALAVPVGAIIAAMNEEEDDFHQQNMERDKSSAPAADAARKAAADGRAAVASTAIDVDGGEDQNHGEDETSPHRQVTSTGINGPNAADEASNTTNAIEATAPPPVPPGAFRVHPSNPTPRLSSAAADSNPSNDDDNANIVELAELLGIPMVEAEAVNPAVDSSQRDEEFGASDSDELVAVSQNVLPSTPNTGGEGGGESNHDPVIQARRVPTFTIFGKTIRRSTAGLLGIILVALIATVVAIVSNKSSNSDDDVLSPAEIQRRKEARERRRQVLVDLLSPSVSRKGAFDVIDDSRSNTTILTSHGRNHRVQALEWLVDDFSHDVENANEMLDYYPEWKMKQRYILALLYFATNGPEWHAQIGFLSDADECNWSGAIPRYQGNKMDIYNSFKTRMDESLKASYTNRGRLTCNLDGRVETISIGVNNLVGTMPEELSELRESLVKLGLMRNSLTSTIPSSFAELKNLETLNLMENCLTGTIPEDLPSRLTKLRTGHFQKNNDLRGNLNGFCNGTENRQIIAECGDCPGSMALVECTCCTCSDFNTMQYCNKDGTVQVNAGKLYAWETFNRGECSLNDVQRTWKEENCHCFVEKNSRFVCSTECPS